MSPWYCTACGGSAEYTAASLDPAHPLGYCAERTRPCRGTVILTRDLDELARLQEQSKLAAARKRHREHLGPRGKLSPTCTYCIALEAGRAVPA